MMVYLDHMILMGKVLASSDLRFLHLIRKDQALSKLQSPSCQQSTKSMTCKKRVRECKVIYRRIFRYNYLNQQIHCLCKKPDVRDILSHSNMCVHLKATLIYNRLVIDYSTFIRSARLNCFIQCISIGQGKRPFPSYTLKDVFFLL